ncbi:MAG: hypothetical protein P1V81_06895 [Planctomycetota bacterium]|nr:hypothetical protein [Planctomycetota bacterium]
MSAASDKGLWVERLHVERAPGLPGGLPALELAPDLTILLGPNASGKSTFARCVRASLWAAERQGGDRLSARWRQAGQVLDVELRAGRVHWEPAPPVGVPPGAASLARLGIRDLLDSEADVDREVAQRVQLELAGGLDLGAARASFGASERLVSGARLTKLRAEASDALRSANALAGELLTKEARLAELADEVQQLEARARDLEACRAQRAVLESDLRLAALVADEQRFPADLDRLQGGELEALASLEAAVADCTRERDQATAELEQVQAELDRHGFAGAVPDEAQLEAWAKRLEGLATKVLRRDELTEQLARATARAEAARERLVAEAGIPPTPEQLDALGALIEKLRGARAEAQGAHRVRNLWGGRAEGPDPGPLRTASAALRAWLRTPAAVGQAATAAWLPRVLTLGGPVLLLVALALWQLGAELGPGPGTAALAGVGLALLLLGLRGRPATESGAAPSGGQIADLRVHQRAAEEAGLAPAEWTTPAVEAQLEVLQRDLAAAESARTAADLARSAGDDERRLTDTVEALAAELAALLASTGLASDLADLGAAEQLSALRRWHDAEDARSGPAGALAQVTAELEAGLSEAGVWLTGFDASLEAVDVEAARASRSVLERRCRRLQAAEEARDQATRELARRTKALATSQVELAAFWTRVGLDAEAADSRAVLARRLDQLADWAQHRTALAEARTLDRAHRETLAKTGPPEHLATLDEPGTAELLAALEEWIEAHGAARERLDQLLEERGSIQGELERAREGHRMTDALAKSHEAESLVAAEREEAAEQALARLLLDEARDAHDSDHAPRLLERARQRFSSFTGHRWRLEVASERGFQVREATTDAVLGLDQLSDGTRIQLLLAARLTALEELEAQGPLPLALDEALSTTDPQRFTDIAAALYQVADEGRQLLYLTADPAEAAQWCHAARALGRPEPKVIDLGAELGEGAAWTSEVGPPATPVPRAPIPAPGDLDPAAYAERLGVPALDGFEHEGTWHLYVAAWSDLTSLHRALSRRVASLGHWRAVRAAGETPPGIDDQAAAAIDARVELAIAFAPRWRQGRGRPVTWQDVEASGSIGPSFEDRVREVLTEHGRSPGAFLEAVRAIKRFRAAQADELQAHLETIGCLPTEPPLADTELVERTLRAAPDAVEVLGYDAAEEQLDWLLALVRAGEAQRSGLGT